MKAMEYAKVLTDGEERDTLVDYIESDVGMARIDSLDNNWDEVMRMCESNGFIIQAYGGTAIISTNRAYLEANGAEKLARRMRMCNVDL